MRITKLFSNTNMKDQELTKLRKGFIMVDFAKIEDIINIRENVLNLAKKNGFRTKI